MKASAPALFILIVLQLAGLTPAVADSGVITVRAASFSATPVGHALESGRWSLTERGRIQCVMDVPTNGLYTFVIVARGEEAEGVKPVMAAGVDGEEMLKHRVGSTDWATYAFSRQLSQGRHELFVGFLNDYFGPGGDRNLQVGQMSIVSPDGAGAVAVLSQDDYLSVQREVAARLMEEADERINEIRKGTLAVAVIDTNGEPVEGARVAVRQKRHEFLFGTALCTGAFDGSLTVEETQAYLQAVEQYFNHAVPENAMKWQNMEPTHSSADYTVVDEMVAWCDAHNIPLRGHTIFWACEEFVPDWVKQLNDNELKIELKRRARIVAGRYAEKIDELDVNNEMLHCSYFRDRLGDAVVEQMFKDAKSANKNARLYLNDYGILDGQQLDAYTEQIRSMLDEGVPVGGIGVQAHVGSALDPRQVKTALDELSRFDLPIKITEFSCDAEDPEIQSRNLETIYRLAFAQPAVEGILMWGFWEKCHWKPDAAMLAVDFSKTELLDTYTNLVFKAWWTREEGATDEEGLFSCEAFFGDLEVLVTTENGWRAVDTLSLQSRRGTASIVLELEPPPKKQPSRKKRRKPSATPSLSTQDDDESEEPVRP